METVCRWCKQNFQNNRNGTRKFCSVSCRDKFRWWDRKREKTIKKFIPNKCKCVFCGTEFLNTTIRKPAGRKYCNRICLKKHWRKNNPEKEREQQKRVVEKRKLDPVRIKLHRENVSLHNKTPDRKFSQYKKGSVVRGLEFSITFDQFMSFWGKDCSYCGDSIETVGIDRTDNKVGYTIENCASCCKTCNNMKKELEVSFFLKQCKKIASTAKV